MSQLIRPYLAADPILPSLYRNLSTGPDGQPQFTSLSDIWIIIANVVSILIALAGLLAIIFIVVGGIFYVISAGDPGKVKRAKDIIVQSVIGLIIISLAYTIVTFIANAL